MGNVPKKTQTFPNELKFSGLVEYFAVIIFYHRNFFLSLKVQEMEREH